MKTFVYFPKLYFSKLIKKHGFNKVVKWITYEQVCFTKTEKWATDSTL